MVILRSPTTADNVKAPMRAFPTAHALASGGATSVTVVNENRTIPVTNGTFVHGHFATGNTVHIYRVGP